MEYQKAYETFQKACEDYGMEPIDFQQFMKYLTEEQLNAYCQKAC